MADKSIAINPNLISVWLLDAQGTEVLTDAFYKTLPKENITNTQALQQAQLSWLLTPEYSHP
ncbi:MULTISPECIES: hypothetical protein [Moorena]|uniref:Uncharacterized protein n=1 Tax=Moorena producens (strain JHB) TaxID=1454205 RepID=A0A1D9FU90_MOOP1|nr:MULTISPECIES: hypothetical protein [Moorena]NEQ16284.1 hypothetical protein [Moorena sp. SIO3E2]AOY78946.1 hypothetical protein BJP36_02535 [Moorena producens JHB]NEP31489.1 hypothetical protein [Moorena sp. SIO3B2]NEQ09079.1 hypothetical protein [Moorena sp. SIO4E2]NES40828.1 hypothetical protein [Moorena sp. SIO2C4]